MTIETTDRARDLFEAARADGPNKAAREAMWSSIQGATVGGATSLAAVKATGVLSSKLALGIALGATLTIGIAATVVALTRPASLVSPRAADRIALHEPRALAHVTQSVDSNLETPPPVVVTGHVPAQAQAAVELDQKPAQSARADATRSGTTTMSEHDRLAREARMVSEARGALQRGEPETALRVVRAARTQVGARLVPEELTVEAQALRAMGDEAGAQRVEAELAGKFPEQAIAH